MTAKLKGGYRRSSCRNTAKTARPAWMAEEEVSSVGMLVMVPLRKYTMAPKRGDVTSCSEKPTAVAASALDWATWVDLDVLASSRQGGSREKEKREKTARESEKDVREKMVKEKARAVRMSVSDCSRHGRGYVRSLGK
jgi:hypothetical protein